LNADQQLFGQHAAHWIGPGLPGAGHVLVFNNGLGRTTRKFSSVEEIILPVDSQGQYLSKPGTAYGPDKPIWSYMAPTPTDFFSEHLSSAQRLKNGNTLICSGDEGRIFEITPKGEVVWDYRMAPHVGPAMAVPGFRKPWTAPASDSVFCAWRYAPNYTGLAGKVLAPGQSVEELEPNVEIRGQRSEVRNQR
jgi:hypothetical protein